MSNLKIIFIMLNVKSDTVQRLIEDWSEWRLNLKITEDVHFTDNQQVPIGIGKKNRFWTYL